ncbi:hypothetical protein HHL26_06615 [Sphingobium sp. TB-6]|uniref:hypothetical protein n=1 Tax=Sphingobium sp. TB-6 TaxID=2728850 RepID=UPI00146DCCF3|nr:hypothetical protein [Sphingobium sp. TB-6]NML88739.1 hypothetical protein [Sphingobium sp. TB-6]
MISPTAISKVAEQMADLYEALRLEHQGEVLAGSVPAITRHPDVRDRMTGMLFAIHHIGLTLDAIGGDPLVHRVILEVEERLDDVHAHVFLNRRWDGFPRP